MKRQYGAGADTKAGPRMSLRDAIAWAMAIGIVGNIILFIIAAVTYNRKPSGVPSPVDRLFDDLAPGFAIWNAVFGGPWHSMVWFFSTLALNFIIYSAIAFMVEIVFIYWRRRLHPVNTASRTLFR